MAQRLIWSFFVVLLHPLLGLLSDFAQLLKHKHVEHRFAVAAIELERLDAVNARRGVEMIVVAPVLAVRVVLGRFLQVNCGERCHTRLHRAHRPENHDCRSRVVVREAR